MGLVATSKLPPNQGPKAGVEGLTLVQPGPNSDGFPFRNILPGEVQIQDAGGIAHALQVFLGPNQTTLDHQGRVKKTISVSYSAMKVC